VIAAATVVVSLRRRWCCHKGSLPARRMESVAAIFWFAVVEELMVAAVAIAMVMEGEEKLGLRFHFGRW